MTREDILTRRAKRVQLAEQLEELQRQISEEDRWFEAVRLIVPAHLLTGVEQAVIESQEGPEKTSIWRHAISQALYAATQGLLPKDIAVYIKEHGSYEANERIIRNPNGLYNALSRMYSDGHIYKRNDKFYRLGLYEDLLRSGRLDEEADERSSSGVGSFILSLFTHSDRMLPRNIIANLREHKEYAERIENNPQYGYSAIARLVRQQRLVKVGSYYSLPPKENEPSDVSPSNGSDAGSGDERPRALRLV